MRLDLAVGELLGYRERAESPFSSRPRPQQPVPERLDQRMPGNLPREEGPNLGLHAGLPFQRSVRCHQNRGRSGSQVCGCGANKYSRGGELVAETRAQGENQVAWEAPALGVDKVEHAKQPPAERENRHQAASHQIQQGPCSQPKPADLQDVAHHRQRPGGESTNIPTLAVHGRSPKARLCNALEGLLLAPLQPGLQVAAAHPLHDPGRALRKPTAPLPLFQADEVVDADPRGKAAAGGSAVQSQQLLQNHVGLVWVSSSDTCAVWP